MARNVTTVALTGEQYTIRSGEHEATVVEAGAGLRRYAHAGREVTCGYREDQMPPQCCGGVLVPWPNRLRGGRYVFDSAPEQVAISEPASGNAIHGLGRWVRWSPVRHDTDAVTLALDLVPQTGWPFEVRVEVGYALDARTGLSVTATAHNHGASRAPFGAGFHPYLSCRDAPLDEVRLTIPGATQLVFDETQIPVGSTPVAGTRFDLRGGPRLGSLRLDDCFTDLDRSGGGRGSATLGLPSGGGAHVWFDGAFGHLQVFTLDAFPGAGSAVAIEPMSCAPDAFNSGDGLVVLDPDGSWSGTWGITPFR